MASPKHVIITGGNSGVGLSIAHRLLSLDSSIVVCLACRNLTKADVARSGLLEQHPGSIVEVLKLDTSDLNCVYEAANEVKQRYQRLDYIFCNAGILPVSGLNWTNLAKRLTSLSGIVDMLTTGEGMFNVQDDTTKDGLKTVFSTNLFGHFILVQELVGLLSGSGGGHIIWTSSSNACRSHFDITDVQHENGTQSYSSSKYAMDLLSIGLNEEYNSQGLFSHVTCPGISMTNITNSILPWWFWTLNTPFMLFMRLFVPRVTLHPDNGAEAMVWLYQSNRAAVEQNTKHVSCCTILGKRYVFAEKIDFDPEEPGKLFKKLCELEASFKSKYQDSAK